MSVPAASAHGAAQTPCVGRQAGRHPQGTPQGCVHLALARVGAGDARADHDEVGRSEGRLDGAGAPCEGGGMLTQGTMVGACRAAQVRRRSSGHGWVACRCTRSPRSTLPKMSWPAGHVPEAEEQLAAASVPMGQKPLVAMRPFETEGIAGSPVAPVGPRSPTGPRSPFAPSGPGAHLRGWQHQGRWVQGCIQAGLTQRPGVHCPWPLLTSASTAHPTRLRSAALPAGRA